MVTKKKRTKKTKRDWRKHSDVKDVEEYLETCRRDERLGVSVSNKPDTELYFVDSEKGEAPVSTRLKRSEIRKKPLRSELHLQPKSGIQGFPPRKRRGLGRASLQEPPATEADSSSEGEYSGSTSYKSIKCDQIQRIFDHKDAFLKEERNKPQTMKDLWEEEVPNYKINDEHYLRVTRQKEVKKPKSMAEVPSLLKSVELPHPGMSYNPSFEDHQALLKVAVEVEENKLKAAEKLKRKLQMTAMSHVEREKVWMEEMREGLQGEGGDGDKVEEEENEREGGEEEGVCHGQRPIRAEERKTRKQRRRELMRKKEEWLRKQQKTRRVQMDEVYRLRSIRKEILKKEEASEKKKERLSNLQKKVLYGTRRLGRLKYVDAVIPVKLSSELSGSLRALECEGSLAMDRYKSLQRRNIIEPRQLVQPHRKYRRVIKEKHSAKMD